MLRYQITRFLALSLIAAGLVTVPATTAGAAEPVIVFRGGGFGHGVGMSQYGAYGRADAGHLYDQILSFYYDGTELTDVDTFSDAYTDFSVADDVDVRVAIRSTMAVSTPVEQVGNWTIDVIAGGEVVGSATKPITADWDGGRWTAVSDGVDLCSGKSACAGNALEFEMDGEERVVLEENENGVNFGEYRSGRIILHPANLPGPKGTNTTLCGSGDQFCVIHGDLDLQNYLYGLSEVPFSWPSEALKAQAVAGRSYAASRILLRNASSSWAAPFDLYESVQDQFYIGWHDPSHPSGGWSSCTGDTWCAAVDATDDEVVTHEGTVAETFYSASNGGATAEPPDVWAGGTTRPYLKAKSDPFDSNDANPYKIRDHVYTVEQVSDWLNAYEPPSPVDPNQLKVGTVQSISINAGPSGRVTFAEVTIVGTDKTTVVTDRVSGGVIVDDGPYGFRFYAAIKEGCEATLGCIPLRSTNFKIASFFDIHPDDFFYAPVLWMADEDITNGVAPNLFAPYREITRAEVATFIWRFMDEPPPGAPSGFEDVPDEAWYADPIAWMRELDITTGTSPTEFSPNHIVTRGQLATFLHRLAGEPAAPATDQFEDVEAGRYFTDPIAWMVHWDITTGTSPTTFSPNDPLTRGQIATFLWRLAGTPDAFADHVILPSTMRA